MESYKGQESTGLGLRYQAQPLFSYFCIQLLIFMFKQHCLLLLIREQSRSSEKRNSQIALQSEEHLVITTLPFLSFPHLLV